MLKQGTSDGMPHVMAAPLAIFGLRGERVFPKMTLPILSTGSPERSTDVFMIGAIRSIGANERKIPPKSPIAERTALTTKTFRSTISSFGMFLQPYPQHSQTRFFSLALDVLTHHGEEKEFVVGNRFPAPNDDPLFYLARFHPLGHGSEDQFLGIGLYNF